MTCPAEHENLGQIKKAGRYPDLFLSLKALTASTSVVSLGE